jgi:hypothetical protein
MAPLAVRGHVGCMTGNLARDNRKHRTANGILADRRAGRLAWAANCGR